MRLRWTKAQSTVLSSTELKSVLGEKWEGKRNIDSIIVLDMLERRGRGDYSCSIPLNDVSGGSQQQVSLTVSHLWEGTTW